MSAQMRLRLKLRNLEKRQAIRVEMVEQRKQQLDECVERHDREITNLRSQLTIGVAP